MHNHVRIQYAHMHVSVHKCMCVVIKYTSVFSAQPSIGKCIKIERKENIKERANISAACQERKHIP
jgi:hypothetical protein